MKTVCISQSIFDRFNGLVTDYKRYMNNQYKFASAFVIIEDYRIDFIEDYPCKSK
jgi:hypothetical protein